MKTLQSTVKSCLYTDGRTIEQRGVYEFLVLSVNNNICIERHFGKWKQTSKTILLVHVKMKHITIIYFFLHRAIDILVPNYNFILK